MNRRDTLDWWMRKRIWQRHTLVNHPDQIVSTTDVNLTPTTDFEILRKQITDPHYDLDSHFEQSKVFEAYLNRTRPEDDSLGEAAGLRRQLADMTHQRDALQVTADALPETFTALARMIADRNGATMLLRIGSSFP